MYFVLLIFNSQMTKAIEDFYMFNAHLYVLFGEVFVKIFSRFLYWLVYFIIEL